MAENTPKQSQNKKAFKLDRIDANRNESSERTTTKQNTLAGTMRISCSLSNTETALSIVYTFHTRAVMNKKKENTFGRMTTTM